jgi:hypothetical protein
MTTLVVAALALIAPANASTGSAASAQIHLLVMSLPSGGRRTRQFFNNSLHHSSPPNPGKDLGVERPGSATRPTRRPFVRRRQHPRRVLSHEPGPFQRGFCCGTFGYYVCSPSHCVCVCAAARSLRCWRFLSRFRRRVSRSWQWSNHDHQSAWGTTRSPDRDLNDRSSRALARSQAVQSRAGPELLQLGEHRLGSRWAPSRFLGHDDHHDQYIQRASRPQHPYGQGSSSPARRVRHRLVTGRVAVRLCRVHAVCESDRVDLHGARRRVRAHAFANRELGSGRVAFLVSRRQEIGVRDERCLGVFGPAARPLRVGGRRGRQRSASGREKRSRSCLVAQRPHDRLPRFLRDQAGYARGHGCDAAARGPSLSRNRSRWPAGLVTRRPKDRRRKQAGCLRDERRRLEPFKANLGRPHRHLRVLPADVATTTALGEGRRLPQVQTRRGSDSSLDGAALAIVALRAIDRHLAEIGEPERPGLTVKPPPAAFGAAHLSRCLSRGRLHVPSSIAARRIGG